MIMKKMILLCLLTLFLFSCKTTEDSTTEPEEQIDEEAVLIEPAETETIVTEKPEVSEKEGIEVSEDLYKKTFDEIEDLINQVTQLIRKRNFNGWKKFLSENYIEMVGSAEHLRKVSESPSLKDVIELRNLRDYFQWVVVPSRANAKLDEIIFIDEEHVIAYMYIEDNRTILFQFEIIDGIWKITIW